jgi:hypothetical protein
VKTNYLHPKVASLAKKVHDSGTLKEKFDCLVSAHGTLQGDKRALDHHVPTQWNSELDCLKAHLYFHPVIEAFTSPTENGLRAYCLTYTQWDLAEDVADVLLVCFRHE